MAQGFSFTTPLPQPRKAGAIIPISRMDSETASSLWSSTEKNQNPNLAWSISKTLDAFCTSDCVVPLEAESPRTDCASWDREGTHVHVGFGKQAPFLHTAEEGIQL